MKVSTRLWKLQIKRPHVERWKYYFQSAHFRFKLIRRCFYLSFKKATSKFHLLITSIANFKKKKNTFLQSERVGDASTYAKYSVCVCRLLDFGVCYQSFQSRLINKMNIHMHVYWFLMSWFCSFHNAHNEIREASWA